MNKPSPLLTVNEACECLRVSKQTLYRLLNAGEVPYLRVRERLRFRVSELDAYLERDRHLTPSAPTGKLPNAGRTGRANPKRITRPSARPTR